MATHFTIPETATTDAYRVSPALAMRVANRDGSLCVYCGRGAQEIDHVRPASHFVKGASRDVVNHPSNLVACCTRCNNVKAGAGLEGFAEKLLSLGVSERKVTALRARVDAATSRELPGD